MNGKTMAAGTLGFLVASSIGAALGVLFAPKAGTDTRQDMADKARKLAWRFNRSRAEVQDSVNNVFGKVTNDLEEAYLQIRGEILAAMDELEPSAKTKAAYKDIVNQAVHTVSKGKRWTKNQIDKLRAHLEGEYEEPKKTDEV
jgi:gas vesicle protein